MSHCFTEEQHFGHRTALESEVSLITVRAEQRVLNYSKEKNYTENQAALFAEVIVIR